MSQRSLHKMSIRLAALFVLVVLSNVKVLAQAASQYDRGTPPPLAAGVGAFGSYSSPDLGTANLSNGSLNLAIPLGTVGGRGFAIPITLNYSSKVWSVNKETDYFDGVSTVAYAAYGAGDNLASYDNRLTPGWTVGVVPWMIVRSFGIDPLVHPGCGFNRYLTKLTVSLPDRGEIELRDDYTDGAPHLATTKPNTGNCKWYDAYRGRRWHAADGSGIIFVSDVDNGIVDGNTGGVLITADGMRYRFDTTNLPGLGLSLAQASSVTDRNGNKITITYPSNTEINYTDQLNRVTKIKKSVQDPQTGQQLELLVELPGYGGVRYFKVKSGVMNQNYRTGINPVLPVITGTNNPQNHQYIDPWWGNGGSQLFPESNALFAGRVDAATVVNEVILPDNRSIRFKYNEYGEVAEVQLPTGGKLQYDYDQATALPTGLSLPAEVQTFNMPMNLSAVDRAIVARRSYADGANLEGSWTYTYTATTAEARAFSATNTLLRNEKHYFMPAARYLQAYNDSTNGTGYSLWSTGVESRNELRNASNAVISATEYDWTQRATVSWWTGYAQQQPANDNRVNQTRRYLETGMMAKVENLYDQYNNLTEVKEYDYDQTLKRRTVTTYLSTNNGVNYQTDDAIHLLSLDSSKTIYDGSGSQKSRSVTEYDQYVNDGNRAALTSYASVSQHDFSYGTARITRGNPTRTERWLNTSGTYIYTYPRYDIVGNVVSLKDEGGSVSTISFADDFGLGSNPGTPTQNPATPTYAFPTLYTSPPPLPGAPVHTARSQYDYSSGLLTGFRDRNNIITQTIYNDPFNRPTQTKSALGVTGVEHHVSTYYAPTTVFGITLAKNDVLTANDLNSIDDAGIRSWTVTDGFGRTREAWKRDPLGDVKVVSVYDGLGRIKQTSNPFRPPEPAVYTTTVYDLAGRITSVTTPDNAAVTTTYATNTVTVTDQAGKARKSVTDGLGRLIEVREDPNGLNYQTSYTYDVLDNLVKITQGTQQRFFMYDSLKRLIRARNLEQATYASLNLADSVTGNGTWSFGYQYDVSGNLTQKTDPRGIVTNFAYDAFNRSTTIDYSDTPSINPDVKRFYDGATNGKGRFWYFYKGGDISTGSNVDHTAIDSYDGIGRPLVQRQLFKLNGTWGPTYQVSRAYNRAGGVTSQTYPSGRTVTTGYDVIGRTSSVTGTIGDGVSRSYASTFLYNPQDQLTQELFGTQTPLYHKLQYNIRGQLWDVRVATGSDVNGSWNRGCLQFFYDGSLGYGTSGPDNNGNVRFANTYIPFDELSTTWAIHRQSYNYDSLNRLGSVTEYFVTNTQAESQHSMQTYTYDRWGNRTINAAQTSGVGINNKVFSVDTATNRMGVPVGQPGVMTYDNAGNLTTDTYSGAGGRTYDADNRMITAADNTGQISRYTYDADGERVRVQVASGQENWHVYGFDNELLAEYWANAAASSPEKEYGYRNREILVTATGRFNVALASNGAVATASSTATGSGFSTTGAINGNNRGPWGDWLEGWNDNTPGVVPDWIQVDFAGSKTIDEISVFSLHDNYTQENTPTETQTFTLYGLLAFNVQYWNNGVWTTIPGGTVTGNNKVWRKFTFSPITTSKIRVTINTVPDSWSRVVEIQAFGTSAGGEKIQWLVPDHLGSARIVLDQTGSLANTKRHDYLPFGEELVAGTGGRTVAQGYSGDGVRQQFTSKERDNETGLDYFLARYYSAIQGRFTSPDEFTGGPNELFDFTGAAAENPTFYADLTHPQSLNKYQYCFNNPLIYVDPDGHQQAITQRFMWEKAPESRLGAAAKKVGAAVDAGGNVITGVGKGVANVGIGVNNLMAAFNVAGAEEIEPYTPDNKSQEVGMVVAEDVSMFAGLLSGRARVGGVAVAEAESTTAAAANGANGAARSSRSLTATQMAENLSNEIGKNSVQYRTPNAVGHIDLKGKAHFDKPSGGYIRTPHVQERRLHVGPGGVAGGGRINVGPQTTRPATRQDVRTARRLVQNRR